MNEKHLRIHLLTYGVNKAPAQDIWKICQQCLILESDTRIDWDSLDWVWIEKKLGILRSQIDED